MGSELPGLGWCGDRQMLSRGLVGQDGGSALAIIKGQVTLHHVLCLPWGFVGKSFLLGTKF